MRKCKVLIIIFRWIIFLGSVCIGTLYNITIEAANKASISNGNIIFETVDTKAISNIRWLTVGFTIRKDCSYGNPLKDGNYAEIHLQSHYQKVEDQGNGMYHITYTIPKEKVDRALIYAGLDEIKDGDSLYFNTVFRIKVHDVIQFKKYYRLNDIRNAACWRNPNDFKEHFDIKVTFHSAKYPVIIEYRTGSNELIRKKNIGNWKAGKEVTVSIEGQKNFEGQKYILCKSYCIDLLKSGKKRNVKIVPENSYGQGHIQKRKLRIGGMKVIARMKKEPEPEKELPPIEEDPYKGRPPTPVNSIEKKAALEKLQAQVQIKAEKKGKEVYQADIAIPSGEKLYIEGSANNDFLEYKFTKYKGSVVYNINIEMEYILKWKEKIGKQWVWKDKVVNGDKTVYITREYSYWEVDYFNYYTVDEMIIENEVLPSGKVTIINNKKDIDFEYKKTKHNYPLVKNITVPISNEIQIVSSENVSPTMINYSKIAEQAADKIKTANDFLSFDGSVILNNEKESEKTNTPMLPEPREEMTKFYKDGLKIPDNKKNDEYLSEAYLYYKKEIAAIEGVSSIDLNHTAEKVVYTIDAVNPITVFTPIVCQGNVTDQSYLCQKIAPNPARCQLILDTEFSVSASCYGKHLDYKGYGIQDYERFCQALEVCIPFDVYKGNTFYPAGTWNRILGAEKYYVPIWVKEGDYTISFRATARNGIVGQIGMEQANFDYDYYAAISSVPVEISGRMYGLKLYDITDYPLWYNVFRKEHSMQLSGTAYYVGTKNQNGVETGLKPIYTLPVLAGSHPYYKNIGYLKTGYVLRCNLKTIGSFYHKEDAIRIKPRFYFVDKHGDQRERVDIYYNESVFGQYQSLIRVGSERDKKNIRTLSLGSEGLSVELQELIDTAFVKKSNIEMIRNKKIEWKGYQDLKISSVLQTFTGNSHIEGQKRKVPIEINKKKVLRSKQNWYFEYYLPASYHIVKHGFDLEAYTRHYPIDFKEDFWKKEGFLIVQFHIYAEKEKKKELCYINNKKQYCNMWRTEGFLYNRIDENGITFSLQDGDFAVFYYGKKQPSSTGEDYAAGGTH